MPNLTFLNHAGFIVTEGDFRFICDPWLNGSVFNEGWQLLIETPPVPILSTSAPVYLWISHEHPDHFSPSFFKSIPEEARSRFIVLFQETKDQKVVQFCQNLGFKVEQLPDRSWTSLQPGVEVFVGREPIYDSWLILKIKDCVIVDVNDCVIMRRTLKQIHKLLPKIDVLLSQFSYAAWRGNPSEKELRVLGAKEQFEQMTEQIQILKPTYVMPFASLVYFSHVENSFLNDSVNDIKSACSVIEKAGAIPLVLFPGDSWTIGENQNNSVALSRYQETYAKIQSKTEIHKTYSFQELQREADQFISRVQKKNLKFWIFLIRLFPFSFFRPILFFVKDIGKSVVFDFVSGLKESSISKAGCDVILSSDSLRFLFRYEYGYDTLIVNGRFEATQKGYRRLLGNFFVSSLNNAGLVFTPFLIFNFSFMRRMIRVLLAPPRTYVTKLDLIMTKKENVSGVLTQDSL